MLEGFDYREGFVQTHPESVRISDGQVLWYVPLDDGIDRWVYRKIPAFSGDVRITVAGKVDQCAGNSKVIVGIGHDPGGGMEFATNVVAIQIGYNGAGCLIQGYVVNARGVDVHIDKPSGEVPPCSGPWRQFWITSGQTYVATLEISEGSATLSVDGLEDEARGVPIRDGLYDTLVVGHPKSLNDPGWCRGSVDWVLVERLG